jgi:HSP20 family protein
MTTLVKQSRLPEFDAMERTFRRMFEGIPLIPAFGPPTTPATDVYETSEEFIVELEVPGYEEKELGVEIHDHTLVVKGDREELKEETEKAFKVHERLERHFERTFTLPPEIDSEQITARFEKGVLKVHAPKLESVQPRKIAITS